MMAGKYSELALQKNNETDAPSPEIDAKTLKTMVKAVAFNLIRFHKDIIPYLLPSLLLLFIALGLFGAPWPKERLARECYLILFCLFTILGYALSVVQTRYFYVLLPICFGWIAGGIIQSKRWLHESIQNWTPNKSLQVISRKSFVTVSIILIYLYVLPINFFTHPRETAWEERAYEERDAGLWLKKNGKPSATIFSASRRPVFYAEGTQIAPETTNAADLLALLEDCKIDYIVLGERSLKRNPFLTDVIKALQNDPEFEVIYQKNEPGYEISIFRSRSCNTP